MLKSMPDTLQLKSVAIPDARNTAFSMTIARACAMICKGWVRRRGSQLFLVLFDPERLQTNKGPNFPKHKCEKLQRRTVTDYGADDGIHAPPVKEEQAVCISDSRLLVSVGILSLDRAPVLARLNLELLIDSCPLPLVSFNSPSDYENHYIVYPDQS
jgi:hypothetical protein